MEERTYTATAIGKKREPSKSHGSNRMCEVCSTLLSMYNPDTRCSSHSLGRVVLVPK